MSLNEDNNDNLLETRDKNIPPSMRYGTIDSVSIRPVPKIKYPDSGNATIQSASAIKINLETGGAAFLNTHELYYTATLNPTITSTPDTLYTNQCCLDGNSDALIRKMNIYINGTLVESVEEINVALNIFDLLNNQSEKFIAVNPIDTQYSGTIGITQPTFTWAQNTAQTYNITQAVYDPALNYAAGNTGVALTANTASTGIITANTPVSISTDITGVASYQAQQINGSTVWFGGNKYNCRCGNPMLSGSSKQIAGHIPSNIIGRGANKMFPLAFVNSVMIEIYLERPIICLRDISYKISDGTLLAHNAMNTWNYTLTDFRLHYIVDVVQDKIGESIQKAYFSNGLPNLMHSIKLYQMQKDTQAASQNTIYNFTLSGTAFTTLLFFLRRNNDISYQEACSLTNFPFGFAYAQVTINGQKYPSNKIDMYHHAYEGWRQMGYAKNQLNYYNQAMVVQNGIVSSGTNPVGAIGSNAQYVATTEGTNNLLGIQLADEWNADIENYSDDYAIRQQGCTVFVHPLNDPRATEDYNVINPVCIRGKNVQFEVTYIGQPTTAITCYCLALQESVLVYKGSTVSVIS